MPAPPPVSGGGLRCTFSSFTTAWRVIGEHLQTSCFFHVNYGWLLQTASDWHNHKEINGAAVFPFQPVTASNLRRAHRFPGVHRVVSRPVWVTLIQLKQGNCDQSHFIFQPQSLWLCFREISEDICDDNLSCVDTCSINTGQCIRFIAYIIHSKLHIIFLWVPWQCDKCNAAQSIAFHMPTLLIASLLLQV